MDVAGRLARGGADAGGRVPERRAAALLNGSSIVPGTVGTRQLAVAERNEVWTFDGELDLALSDASQAAARRVPTGKYTFQATLVIERAATVRHDED
jgi:hypothetical protein